jgi:hypothetical protein
MKGFSKAWSFSADGKFGVKSKIVLAIQNATLN